MGATLKLRTLLLLSTAGFAGLILFTSLRSSSERRNPVPPAPALSTKVRPQSITLQSRLQPPPTLSHSLPSSSQSADTVSTEIQNFPPLQASAADDAPLPYWQNWRNALLMGDVRQIPVLGGQLAERLRRNPDAAIYQDMLMLLNDPALSTEDKSLLIGLLGEVATTDALAILMLMAQEKSHSPLYLASLQGISQIAGNRWGGQFHEELSAGLETAWQDMQNRDPAYATTLAKAMARIGSPSGVDALFNSLTDPSRRSNADDRLRLKQKAAFAAIPEVRNPAAIEVIGQRFRQNPIESPGFEVSGLALASMGSPEATENLLNWTETAPTVAASRFEDWFSKIQDLPSVEMLLARQPELAFASTEVESAFNRALNQLNPPLQEDMAASASMPESSMADQVSVAPSAPNTDNGMVDSLSLPANTESLGNDIFGPNDGTAGQEATPLERALESDFLVKHPRRHDVRKKRGSSSR